MVLVTRMKNKIEITLQGKRDLVMEIHLWKKRRGIGDKERQKISNHRRKQKSKCRRKKTVGIKHNFVVISYEKNEEFRCQDKPIPTQPVRR